MSGLKVLAMASGGGLPNGWNLQRVEHPHGWFITKGKICV